MKNPENLSDIKAIIIPTCNDFENIKRANAAIKFVKENNLPKRCIIAGLGPDTNIANGFGNYSKKKEFNFHKELYNYLINNTDWMIGAEINSLNSIENILYSFPENTEGKYALVSFPLHLKRFKKIINDAKTSGKISKNLEIVCVPTSQNTKWIPHEILSNLKYHIKGKKKYFSKKQQ
jgi:hypothetical protein